VVSAGLIAVELRVSQRAVLGLVAELAVRGDGPGTLPGVGIHVTPR
jgi:hypothetical protein